MRTKVKIDFRPVSLEEKEVFEIYATKNRLKSCEFSFANIFCWRSLYDTKIAFVDGFLLTRFNLNASSQLAYMDPLSLDNEPDYGKILPLIAQDSELNGASLHFFINTDNFLDYLKSNTSYAFYEAQHLNDYVYLRDDLSGLVGKKYQPKRNFVNQFKTSYNFDYQIISSANIAQLEQFVQEWYSHKASSITTFSYERKALFEALNNFDRLNLFGVLLRVDGKVIAFSLGSALCDDTFCVHYEKAGSQFKGAYAMINQLLASSLAPNFKHINREEDMGIDGLRKAKRSYHPTHFHKKYQLKALTHLELDCKSLWLEVFGDDPRLVDQFLINYFRADLCYRLYDLNNTRLCSMFFVVPFESDYGKVAYIFAVATQSKYRERGYASSLLRGALEELTAKGYQMATLIASSKENEVFYSKFGFELSSFVEFRNADHYDFYDKGLGKDRLMVLNLSAHKLQLDDKLVLSSVQHLRLF